MTAHVVLAVGKGVVDLTRGQFLNVLVLIVRPCRLTQAALEHFTVISAVGTVTGCAVNIVEVFTAVFLVFQALGIIS